VKQYLRITIGTRGEMETFLQAARKLLHGK
jgi:histidinol-phosphate/aromatic aminotransferase/cobyric acid decarboxylase-like protein